MARQDSNTAGGPAGTPARSPRGELALRTLAMPADANPNGDIFGGWVMAQMDIAGGITSSQRADGRVATVAVDAMSFHRPVSIGDVLCVYAEILRIGTTSITIHIEAWVLRGRLGRRLGGRVLVTEGRFIYVAIDDEGRPRPVPFERMSEAENEAENEENTP